MAGINVKNLSPELEKLVVKDNQVDTQKLQEIANSKTMKPELVAEANKLIAQEHTGNKAWGDVGDIFIPSQQPVKGEDLSSKRKTLKLHENGYPEARYFHGSESYAPPKLGGVAAENEKIIAENKQKYPDVAKAYYACRNIRNEASKKLEDRYKELYKDAFPLELEVNAVKERLNDLEAEKKELQAQMLVAVDNNSSTSVIKQEIDKINLELEQTRNECDDLNNKFTKLLESNCNDSVAYHLLSEIYSCEHKLDEYAKKLSEGICLETTDNISYRFGGLDYSDLKGMGDIQYRVTRDVILGRAPIELINMGYKKEFINDEFIHDISSSSSSYYYVLIRPYDNPKPMELYNAVKRFSYMQ